MVVKTVFCYGTLTRGMALHDRYCRDALTVEPAVTAGRLYHLHYGFPAMFDARDGRVFGEIMTFPDIERTIRALDRLEGYHSGGRSHYLRISKPVTILPRMETVIAWCYVYPEDRLEEIKRIAEFIPGGCWRTFVERNAGRGARSPALLDR